MAQFPITGRFVGDFAPLLVAVDTDDTMDQLAAKVAVLTLGKRLPLPASPTPFDVLLDGEVVPPTTTLADVMAEREVLPLQWFDVRFRESETADV
ncbi:MAG TPA: toluene-4-monooxygenase system B family protein [Nocardioidaceae bacterium]|nr:toluene-4-monooxygenase system B family protein [Nocardioidaceae bacterium]